jgi:hypothetical protein
MAQVVLRCFRCERPAPPVDSPEFLQWDRWGIEPAEFLDEDEAHLLICPECRTEEKRENELGGGD